MTYVVGEVWDRTMILFLVYTRKILYYQTLFLSAGIVSFDRRSIGQDNLPLKGLGNLEIEGWTQDLGVKTQQSGEEEYFEMGTAGDDKAIDYVEPVGLP